LLTVTVTAELVVVLPNASYAFAAMLWLPLAVEELFHA
jgi:hypothetical protein